MSSLSKRTVKASQGYAWLIFFVFGVLFALSGMYIFITGIDQADFQTSTGIAWDEFSGSDPEIASYLLRIIRLLGIGYAGFALVGTFLAFTAFRNGERWAWYTMWLIPVVYGLTAGVMLTDESSIGFFYGGTALLLILVLLLSLRNFLLKRPS